MPTWRRIVVWGGLALLLVALVYVAVRPRPIPVDFVEAGRGALQVTLDEEGETRVRERFVISAPLAGRVLRIELEPGDPVVAGESVLATFEPADPSLLDARALSESQARVKAAEAAFRRAEAEREKAAAQAEFAGNELARNERLANEGVVSDEVLESARLDARTGQEALRAAEFAVRTAQGELELARAGLLTGVGPGGTAEAIALHAPIDGVVLRRFHESEAVVAAGEPLLEVGDPGALEIVADYLSTDAVRIRAGQLARIERWGGDRPLRGRVRRVEPSGFTKVSALGVEEQRVNVILDLDEPQETLAHLGDGYHVEVRVVIWESRDVLKVPTSSLFRAAGGWAVFVVENGDARLRPITVGRRGSLEVSVDSGLEPGEQVIVHPGDTIADGVAVVARSTGG